MWCCLSAFLSAVWEVACWHRGWLACLILVDLMGSSWRLTVLVSVSLVVSGDGVFFVFIGLSFSLLVTCLFLFSERELKGE